MFSKLKNFFKKSDITDEYFFELEDALLTSDIGPAVTEKIMSEVRPLKTMEDVRAKTSEIISGFLKSRKLELTQKPHIIMMIGVNGTGKTTTIAKLANKFKKDGKKVMLVAADTFRAAAIDQLKIWGERLDVPVIASAPDSDPASVAFDGVASAIAKGVDVVILDTAGRLHTNKNLMEELLKIKRVVGRASPDAPHDIILVLDATVGQNGLAQALKFNEVLGVSGVVVAKMDGTAKGGVLISITSELGLPVLYIGTGEGVDNIEDFEPQKFTRDIIG